jgi:hypothetical protein
MLYCTKYKTTNFGVIRDLQWQEGPYKDGRLLSLYWFDGRGTARSATVPMRQRYPGNDPENGPAEWRAVPDKPEHEELLQIIADETHRIFGRYYTF